MNIVEQAIRQCIVTWVEVLALCERGFRYLLEWNKISFMLCSDSPFHLVQELIQIFFERSPVFFSVKSGILKKTNFGTSFSFIVATRCLLF